MGFPRQEYWSGLPFPSLGHLLDPGIEPRSPALAGVFFTYYSIPIMSDKRDFTIFIYVSISLTYFFHESYH